jgi:hypothetical protein
MQYVLDTESQVHVVVCSTAVTQGVRCEAEVAEVKRHTHRAHDSAEVIGRGRSGEGKEEAASRARSDVVPQK